MLETWMVKGSSGSVMRSRSTPSLCKSSHVSQEVTGTKETSTHASLFSYMRKEVM